MVGVGPGAPPRARTGISRLIETVGIVNIYNLINRPISPGTFPNAHPFLQHRPKCKPQNHAAIPPRRRVAAAQLRRVQGGVARARGDSHANPRIHVCANHPDQPRADHGTRAKPQIHVLANQPSRPAIASGVPPGARDSSIPADLRLHPIAQHSGPGQSHLEIVPSVVGDAASRPGKFQMRFPCPSRPCLSNLPVLIP